jgi:hypothetical protein
VAKWGERVQRMRSHDSTRLLMNETLALR